MLFQMDYLEPALLFRPSCSLVSRRYREKTEETKAVQNLLLRRLIQNVTRKKAKKKKKESFRFWT